MSSTTDISRFLCFVHLLLELRDFRARRVISSSETPMSPSAPTVPRDHLLRRRYFGARTAGPPMSPRKRRHSVPSRRVFVVEVHVVLGCRASLRRREHSDGVRACLLCTRLQLSEVVVQTSAGGSQVQRCGCSSVSDYFSMSHNDLALAKAR